VEKDDRAEAAFRARVRILDALSVYEAEVLHGTMRFIEDRVLGVNVRGHTKQETHRNITYATVGRIPKYWRAEVLEATKQFGMTLTMMAVLGARNTYAVCEMFAFITGLSGRIRLHPSLRENKVMSEVVRRRISALGRCSEAWIKARTKNFQEPLNVHWCEPGAECYWLEKRPRGDGLRLFHCSNCHVAPLPSILLP
jgi:hypothetical protein